MALFSSLGRKGVDNTLRCDFNVINSNLDGYLNIKVGLTSIEVHLQRGWDL